MGKKVEELKELINAFGGTVDPNDDTVSELLYRLVNVACKTYEITASNIDGEWSIDKSFSEIKKAVEHNEILHLLVDVGGGGTEVYHWVSYAQPPNVNAVVFSRVECYQNETCCKTLFIYSDDTTEYHETYIVSE